MDLLRNGVATAVDYIERPLFYILRMSDFYYLHPSTAAYQRMAIDFCSFAKDEWEWPQKTTAGKKRAELSGKRGLKMLKMRWSATPNTSFKFYTKALGLRWV